MYNWAYMTTYEIAVSHTGRLQLDGRNERDSLLGPKLDITFEGFGVADCTIRVVDLGLDDVTIFIDVFGDVED